MGEQTKIGWTDMTFNPWTGCTKVSEACRNCYAESWAKRSGIVKWGENAERRRTSAAYWKQPIKWNREAMAAGVRRRVFCASLADVFEDREELKPWRLDLFALIEQTPNLDWLLLTKRPENIRPTMSDAWRYHPLKNVWIGATIEEQKHLAPRADALLSTPARVHFFSCEPLLGPIDTRGYRPAWIIAGFESGPHYRTGNVDDARSLRDQCVAKGIKFFFKQHGGRTPEAGGCLLDGREWKQFPAIEAYAAA